MVSDRKLAVFHILASCQWLLTVGWLKKASPPVGSNLSGPIPLPDTKMYCSNAGSAIASATITGPGTTSLAVNSSNTHWVFEHKGLLQFNHTWPSRVPAQWPPFPVKKLTEVTLQVLNIEVPW